MELRDYRPADLEALFALDLECFDQHFRFSRQAMRRFAEAAGAIALIAEEGSALAGFAIIQVEHGAAYVVTLDVAPTFRRRGVARMLMLELEHSASSAGASEMTLHVSVGNMGAVRFYESLGYERAGETRAFYGPGLDALIFRRKLEA